jgi:hypothetical protein
MTLSEKNPKGKEKESIAQGPGSGNAFSLDRIQSPALVLRSDGTIAKANQEACLWFKKSQKALENLKLEELDLGLHDNLLDEIFHLSPGRSLAKELTSSRISFFPSHFENRFAILVVIQVLEPEWMAQARQRQMLARKKEWLAPGKKNKKRPVSASAQHPVKEIRIQLLLGELAQMAMQMEEENVFLKEALDMIAQAMEIELVFLDQVAQNLEEIETLSETQWHGSRENIEHFRSLAEWAYPVVLDSGKQLWMSDEELLEIIHDENLDPHLKLPSFLLCLPLVWQGEKYGILGLVGFDKTTKHPEFEYHGLLVGDVLSQILAINRKWKELRQQKKKWYLISELHPNPCWSVSADGQVSYFNKPFIDAVILKGAGFGTKISPQHPGSRQLGFAAWEAEYNRAFSGEEVIFEAQTTNGEGETYWWDIVFKPIQQDGLGVSEVLCLAHDITLKRNQQTEMKSIQNQVLDLVQGFDDVYFQADQTGQIQSISASIENWTGISSSVWQGQNLKAMLLPNVPFHRHLVALRDGELVTGLELKMINPEGKDLWFQCNLKPLFSNRNEWLGFEGLARNCTELYHARHQEKKSKLEASDALKVKERFLANISHEIRTPLNGIMGMAQLLEESPLSAGQLEYLEIIKRSGDALLYVLNQLIDLSAAESGKIVLKPSRVHMPTLVDGVYRLYADQARLKNIQFQTEIHPGLQSVMVDESRLYQMMNSLVSNAFKFTIQGSIKLKLILEEGISESFAIMEVSDTGSGLSMAEQASIKQLIDSKNPEYAFNATKGGLGLLTTRLIVDAMHGQMGFVSAPGSGSTFWIRFPFEVASNNHFSKNNGPVSNDFFHGLVPEVLLVDDNAVNLKVANEILVKAGCKVEIATNGEEAVDKVKSGFFHLVLMDIQMPVMDGVTATHIIKSLDLKYNPAIVAMTAYCLKEDKIRFVEAGMDDFIAKPISGEKILGKVKYWAEKNANTGKFRNPPGRKVLDSSSLQTRKNKLESIFDLEVLKNLLKHLGDEILMDSLAEFANETSAMLLEMEAALVTSDWSRIKSHAHTLKGNAGTFGVNRLFTVAKELDNDLKNDKIAAVSGHLQLLRDAAQEFLSSYHLLNKSHDWKK